MNVIIYLSLAVTANNDRKVAKQVSATDQMIVPRVNCGITPLRKFFIGNSPSQYTILYLATHVKTCT